MLMPVSNIKAVLPVSVAQTAAFSEGMNRFTQKSKHNLVGIDACLKCDNGTFSEILGVTDKQTDNPLRMR